MNRPVYITGHTGFIGSALMQAYGDKAVPWDPDGPPGSVLIHLASRVGVAENSNRVLSDVWAELGFHRQVFDFAVRTRTPLLVASSSEVYASSSLPMKESDALIVPPPDHPRWMYARLKLFLEQAAFMFSADTGVPAVVVRLFNVCGPGQPVSSGMVLPKFVHAALHNSPLEIHGDGSQVRTFTHISDAVFAIQSLTVLSNSLYSVYNVGTGNSVTIGSLAEQVKALSGSTAGIVYSRPPEASIMTRVPDVSKLRAALPHWNPKPLEEIITDTLFWMRSGYK